MIATACQSPVAVAANTVSHLSASQVDQFLRCPLQWALGYVLHLEPEFVASALVAGSALHRAVEMHFRARLEGRVASTDELMSTWNSTWTEQRYPVQFGKDETVESLRGMAGGMIDAVVRQGETAVRDILCIEQRFECRISGTLPPFRGVIDLVALGQDEHGRDALHIVDFKTAARRPVLGQRSPDQLLVYARAVEALGLRDEFGLPLRLSYWTVTKRASPELYVESVEHAESGIQRVVAKAESAYRGMIAGNVYPCPGWWCGGCGHQTACKRWPNLDGTKEEVARHAAVEELV